jgi:hypothetical protein
MAEGTFVAGASASLNQTISEIMEFLDDERGHIESWKRFRADSDVPRDLQFECSRHLFPGQHREITLDSKIPRRPRPVTKKTRK